MKRNINWVISMCPNRNVGNSTKKLYGKEVSNSVASTIYIIDIQYFVDLQNL